MNHLRDRDIKKLKGIDRADGVLSQWTSHKAVAPRNPSKFHANNCVELTVQRCNALLAVQDILEIRLFEVGNPQFIVYVCVGKAESERAIGGFDRSHDYGKRI